MLNSLRLGLIVLAGISLLPRSSAAAEGDDSPVAPSAHPNTNHHLAVTAGISLGTSNLPSLGNLGPTGGFEARFFDHLWWTLGLRGAHSSHESDETGDSESWSLGVNTGPLVLFNPRDRVRGLAFVLGGVRHGRASMPPPTPESRAYSVNGSAGLAVDIDIAEHVGMRLSTPILESAWSSFDDNRNSFEVSVTFRPEVQARLSF